MNEQEVIKFLRETNTPSELMVATKALSPRQKEALVLDLVWKLSTDHRRLVAKKAILEAKMKPI